MSDPHPTTSPMSKSSIPLADMERQLASHFYVEKCSVVLFNVDGGEYRRSIGALIVLSENGKEHIMKKGFRVISQTLENDLVRGLRLLPLPIKCRYVNALPEVTSNEVTSNEVFREKITRFFLKKFVPESKEPLLLMKEITAHEITLTFIIPEQLIYFDGHFPSHPVVPAVAQINWVMHYANKYLHTPLSVSGMKVIKFHNVLVPGACFSMKLVWQSANNTLVYRLWWLEKSVSSGRMILN